MTLFRYRGFELEYKDANVLGLIETYLLDIYHIDSLRPSDIVVDLGAGIGDFAIKAARRAGRVIAIEPNKEDFELMEQNIKRNGTNNVVPVNMGVADKSGMETITFGDRTYSFQVDTLQNILKKFSINKVDVLKLDIEGFETKVLADNPHLLKDVRIIPIELHGTKKVVDDLVLPLGFKFMSLTKGHLYMRALKLLFTSPSMLRWALRQRRSAKMPDIVSGGNGLVLGRYVR